MCVWREGRKESRAAATANDQIASPRARVGSGLKSPGRPHSRPRPFDRKLAIIFQAVAHVQRPNFFGQFPRVARRVWAGGGFQAHRRNKMPVERRTSRRPTRPTRSNPCKGCLGRPTDPWYIYPGSGPARRAFPIRAWPEPQVSTRKPRAAARVLLRETAVASPLGRPRWRPTRGQPRPAASRPGRPSFTRGVAQPG